MATFRLNSLRPAPLSIFYQQAGCLIYEHSFSPPIDQTDPFAMLVKSLIFLFALYTLASAAYLPRMLDLVSHLIDISTYLLL